jgi:predicted O-methyltransferase YrrM
MSQVTWTAVDDYFADRLIPQDPHLHAAIAAAEAAGLPPISVSPALGKFLHLTAKSISAARILEIGTLGGYSAIWLARALPPNGRLISLELNEQYAALARQNLDRAGVGHIVEIRTGPALESLQRMQPGNTKPFDLIFIDADKTGYPDYLEHSIRLSHPGTIIIADNVVRDGAIIDSNSGDDAVQAVRRFNDALAADTRLSATAIQTVGVKGYDGFAFIRVERTSD